MVVAKLTATNTTSGNEFGWSVAIDGNTVVVGAWQYPNAVDTTRCIESIPAGWPHAGQTYCCPSGTTRYGDGGACCPGGTLGGSCSSGPHCAIYGNAGLDQCDGITPSQRRA